MEKDYDALLDYFNKNKKCKCAGVGCRHFDRAVDKVLGKRIDDLFYARLNIAVNTYYTYIHEKTN